MRINISKTKAIVIGTKPKKIDIRIKGESVEQVDSFKYLGCNINNNMKWCQEVKHRIAMAKEAFNRKRSIFYGPLEKELRKRLVKCFVWSVVLYVQRPGHYDGMSKNNWKHFRCGYGEGWSV